MGNVKMDSNWSFGNYLSYKLGRIKFGIFSLYTIRITTTISFVILCKSFHEFII
jgi:hypothetical protein